MNRPDELELIDRHLAGVLTSEEEERLEHLIRTSPQWAQRYREAEDFARLMRKGLGDGAPAPDAVKEAIRRRVNRQPERRPAWFTRRQRVGWIAAAATLVLAVGAAAVFWPTDLMPMGFLNEPLALKDLARSSSVAFEATTVLHEGQVRVSPPVRVLYGSVGGRAIAVPENLKPGHRIALFGEFDGGGMIRPVGGSRGIVHLDGVQRWEGKDRQPDESRALIERAVEQRSLKETLADLEVFLASDHSQRAERAGLAFTADVTARHLGAFEFEAIVQPLLKLVLDGDKHPAARNAAAEGLERSNPTRACEALLRAMARRAMPTLQAESEDGHVVLGCLKLLRRSGTASLVPTLEMMAETMQAPALRKAAESALAAVSGRGDRHGALPSVATPVRFDVDGRECIVMAGAQGQRHGLVVVFRGSERVSAFRPLLNAAIARGFGVLVVPLGTSDLDPCLEACRRSGLVTTAPLRYCVDRSAQEDFEGAEQAHPAERVLHRPETLAQAALEDFLAR